MRAFAAASVAIAVALVPASSLAGEPHCRRVVHFIDGDTFDLDGPERVRLIGVDTPETKDPRKPIEYFGPEASAFTRSMLEGKRIRLEYDWQRKDRSGRTLAYVYLEDGTFVNAEIIRQGYGHAYTRFPFRHLEEFRALEREAREAERGLWDSGSPARPARATAPPARSRSGCPADKPIKGNVRSSGVCVFHAPGGRWYSKTQPERCFATEQEARAAGCRAPR